MKKTLIVVSETTDTGLCAHIQNMPGVVTVGNDFSEIRENIAEAVALFVEDQPEYDNVEFEYIFKEIE